MSGSKSKSSKSSKTAPVEVKEEQTSSSKKKKSATTTEVKEEPVQETAKKSKAVKGAKKEAVVVVEAADDDEGVIEKTGLRYFKLDYNGNITGRYSGKKPKQAANKAYSSVVKKEGLQKGGAKIQFSIKECTRGSKQKRYTYDAERVELENPVKVIINGADGKEKPIVYNFNNKLSKAKQIIEQQE